MKSYFAKLADRATLANVPAASPVSAARAGDPFDEPPLAEPHTTSVDKPSLPAQVPGRRVSEAKPPKTASDSLRPPEIPSEVTGTQPPLTATTLLPADQTQQSAIEPRSGERDRSDDFTESKVTALEPGKPEANLETAVEKKPAPPAQPPLAQAKSVDDRATTAPTDEAPLSENRLAQLEREQATLLHKADVFMDHILERRKAAQTKPAADPPPGSRETTPAHPQPQTTSVLQPTPQPLPRIEQDSERPSLVIGKLTVEVTPPAPAPVPAPAPIVVVRGAGSRGSGVPSGRRFGLNQF